MGNYNTKCVTICVYMYTPITQQFLIMHREEQNIINVMK